MLRLFKVVVILLFIVNSQAQTIFTVNSNNDVDDGACDGVHCSLREAIRAADADPMPSVINFAIPGAGPYIIMPSMQFPAMNGNNTFVNGPTAPGSEVVINFGFRVFGGLTFWQINGDNNTIKGLNFTNFNYGSNDDHILQIGNVAKDAVNNAIESCNFYTDVPVVGGIDSRSILISQGTNAKVRTCIFGKDLMNNISQTKGSVLVESSQGSLPFNISNNIFVTIKDCIYAKAGRGVIDSNIFGALDTFKAPNFLDPPYAVLLDGGTNYNLNKNFFFGQTINGIFTKDLTGLTEIKDNIFHLGKGIDIELTGNSGATVGVLSNRGRLGNTFINATMSGNYSLSINLNNISEYQYFYRNTLDAAIDIANYQDNTMTCIYAKVTDLDNSKTAEPNVPVITGINRNGIRGTADPNKTVAIYRNPNGGCLNTNKVCQGGFLFGTATADATGNWTILRAYVPNSTYSAYQFTLGSKNVASEFSTCYKCTTPIKEIYSPDVCANKSVTYRGKTYSIMTPYDSIVVAGDGTICDSVFIVSLNIKNSIREVRNVNYCYNQSFQIGNITINKANPIDSITGLTPIGCDSVVVFVGTERGYSDFKETICSNDFRTINGKKYDATTPKGIERLVGQATGGCDSIINVDLTIKNFAESNLVRTLCPAGRLQVENEIFDINRTSGIVKSSTQSSTGCDSIINVSISFFNPVSSASYDLCSADSVRVGDNQTFKYISTKKLRDTLVIPAGGTQLCDSTIYITVTPLADANFTIRQTICRTDTVEFGGQKFHAGKTTGSFIVTNVAPNKCDSIYQVDLTVRPDAIGMLDTVTCEGSFLDIFGTIFDENKPSGTIKRPKASSFGCDSFIMVNVNFIPLKTGSVNPTICRNGSINIGGTLFNAANPSGIVIIKRSASQGCDSTVNVNVSIAPPITTVFSKKDLKCNVANTGELLISNVGAGGGSNIKVSIDGKTPIAYTPNMMFGSLSAGIHNFLITDANGCDTLISFIIDQGNPVNLSLPNDTLINQGSSVLINANASFIPSKITWDPTTYLSCSDCINPVSVPDEDITYMLILEDENGCIAKDNMTIRVRIEEGDIWVPNIFSPNGDNLNDVVIPEYRFPDKTQILVYRVYDRWGALVYERLNGALGEKFGWNGSFNGEILNPGVYTYAIQFQSKNLEPRWKFGDITLVR
ncbi:MAG: T9SS type B sorting domain-containing protein [Saprospiraceae bacterium]|nr:T9SS type B sorting domain-containing protein [Saprospiraceae bacterium]